MYKYYLIYNGIKTQVEEPIGWDAFETEISRSDNYHGFSAEYANDDITVKFYEIKAIDIINKAYKDDITNLVTFIMEYNGFEEFRGQIDFESYKEVYDKYRYVEVMISEIDVRVTFNNRMSQKVNLDSLTSFDGVALSEYPMLKKRITLPAKDIRAIGQAMIEEGYKPQSPESNWIDRAANPGGVYFNVPFGYPTIEEIPNLYPRNDAFSTVGTSGTNENKAHRFIVFTNKFDADGSKLDCMSGDFHVSIKGKMKLTITRNGTGNINSITFASHIYVGGGEGDNYERVFYKEQRIYKPVPQSIDIDLQEMFPAQNIAVDYGKSLSVFIQVLAIVGSSNLHRGIAEFSDTSFDISMMSKCEDTEGDITFPHEAFARVAESVTNNELTVRSDYYGRPDSPIYPTTELGEASLRSLINGMRIRNYIDKEGNEPAFTLSFEELMKNFIPIDNIGFGFVKEADGMVVRVEPYEWFYQDHTMLTINKPNKKTTTIDSKEVYSSLKIGYKKYETEGTNGIDAIMTEREYRTRQALIENKAEKLSEFVADSYAIEATRRKAYDKDTKDWRYDNNIFVIQLRKNYTVEQIGFSDNVISPDTLYNVRLSPARCARRWTGRLFGWSSKPEQLIFTSGTGNVNAKVAVDFLLISGVVYPYDYVSENENIESSAHPFSCETLAIEHPLSLEDFRRIKQNPYGLVVVDNEHYYLKELKYKYRTRIANFKLIKKNR